MPMVERSAPAAVRTKGRRVAWRRGPALSSMEMIASVPNLRQSLVAAPWSFASGVATGVSRPGRSMKIMPTPIPMPIAPSRLIVPRQPI